MSLNNIRVMIHEIRGSNGTMHTTVKIRVMTWDKAKNTFLMGDGCGLLFTILNSCEIICGVIAVF
jgi:hypothetical protein